MPPSTQILRTLTAGPFRITEKLYRPSASLPTHRHETSYLSFLLAGAYVEVSQFGETLCSSSTVIWHPKSETHSDRFHPLGGHLIDLDIDEQWLQNADDDFPLASRPRVFRSGLPYSLGLSLYRQLQHNTRSTESIAIELLGFFCSAPIDRHPPKWFNRALQRIHDSSEHFPSLSTVAHEAGIHPVYLARSFRRFLGCTFGDYLAKLRIQRAFALLRDPSRPIVDVALDSGFADHAHLCRTFKQSTGLTPSGFRKNLGPAA